MELQVTFPGELQVDANYGPFTIATNQNGTAPPPFALFLASIGTCAGIYVLAFCKQRGLDTTGMKITQKMDVNPADQMIENIILDIKLPVGFPEKYKEAIIRSADRCAVKQHMVKPPQFKIQAS